MKRPCLFPLPTNRAALRLFPFRLPAFNNNGNSPPPPPPPQPPTLSAQHDRDPFYSAQQAPSYACMQQSQPPPGAPALASEAPSWRSLAAQYAQQHELEQRGGGFGGGGFGGGGGGGGGFGDDDGAPTWRGLAAVDEAPSYGGSGGGFGAFHHQQQQRDEAPTYCSMSSLAPQAAAGQVPSPAFAAASGKAHPAALEEEQARWQQQLKDATAAASATAALGALSTSDAEPPIFQPEWKDLSQDHFECAPSAAAAEVQEQLRAALGACQCEVTAQGAFRASRWTIEAACMRQLYAPIHFTASVYRGVTAAGGGVLLVVFQRAGGDLGAYARLVDEAARRCAALVHGGGGGVGAFVPDAGPPTPCELYPGSRAMGKAQMQRHCELLRSCAHPSVRLEAARAVAGACDGADEGSASNRAMLVADFAPIVSVMVGDTHHSREVHLCGQAVLEQLLRFGDATAAARLGIAAYDPRADAGLAQARELAHKLSGGA